MPIKVSCVDCGEVFQVKDEMAGKRVKCRLCGIPVRVPNEVSEDPDEDELPMSRKQAKSKSAAGKKKGKKSSQGDATTTLMIRVGIGIAAALVIGLAVWAINGKMESNRLMTEKNKEIERQNQANAAADAPAMPQMHAPMHAMSAGGTPPATATVGAPSIGMPSVPPMHSANPVSAIPTAAPTVTPTVTPTAAPVPAP